MAGIMDFIGPGGLLQRVLAGLRPPSQDEPTFGSGPMNGNPMVLSAAEPGRVGDTGHDMMFRRPLPRPLPEMAPPDDAVGSPVMPEMPASRAASQVRPRHPHLNRMDAITEESVGLQQPQKIGLGRNILSRVIGGLVGAANPQAGIAARREVTGEAGRERKLDALRGESSELREAYGRELATENLERERGLTEARTAAERAREQSEIAQAGRANREIPQKAAETITVGDKVLQWNPETRRFDIEVGAAPKKAGGAGDTGRTIRTGGRIKQLNPETGRYDIDAGPVDRADIQPPQSRHTADFVTFKDLFIKENNREPTLGEWKQYQAEQKELNRRPDKDVVNMDVMVQDINRIEELANNLEKEGVISNSIGPIDNIFSGLANYVGGAEPQVTEMRRLTGNLADVLLRARSGAAITEQEYARLTKLVPQPNQPFATFMVNLRSLRGEINRTLEGRRGAGRQQQSTGGTAENPYRKRPN